MVGQARESKNAGAGGYSNDRPHPSMNARGNNPWQEHLRANGHGTWDGMSPMMIPVSMPMMMPYGYQPYSTGDEAQDEESSWMNVTTVMMRNLPIKVTLSVLLEEIDEAGFSKSFDFIYLPIDPSTKANRGYAFINFLRPDLVPMFRMHFEGRAFTSFASGKQVHITPATIQGFDDNYLFYQKLRVNQRNPDARPLFLRDPSFARVRPMEPRKSRVEKPLKNQNQAPVESNPVKPPAAPKTDNDKSAEVTKFCTQCGQGGIRPSFKFCQLCGASVASCDSD